MLLFRIILFIVNPCHPYESIIPTPNNCLASVNVPCQFFLKVYGITALNMLKTYEPAKVKFSTFGMLKISYIPITESAKCL